MTDLRICLTLIALACAQLVQAQDLHVYYDLHRDSIWFATDNGKKILKNTQTPTVGRNGTVHVHVQELNNYIYHVQARLEPVPDRPRSMESPTMEARGQVIEEGAENPSIFGMLSKLVPGAGAIGGGGLAVTNIMELARSRSDLSEAEMKASIERANTLVAEAQQTLASMQQDADGIRLLAVTSSRQAQRLTAAALAQSQIKKIQEDPDMAPSDIKKLASQYIEMAYGPGSAVAFDLQMALNWSDHAEKLAADLSQLEQKRMAFDIKHQQLEQIDKRLKADEYDFIRQLNPEFQSFCNQLASSCDQNQKFLKGTRDLMNESRDALDSSTSTMNPEKLAGLYHAYTSIQKNRFAADFDLSPNSKTFDLVIQAFPNATTLTKPANGSREPTPARQKTVRIKTYEGLRITGGGGLFFSQFFKPQYTYSVNNGIILSEPDDQFLPLAATTVSFFSDRGRPATLGAMLGVGLPVLSSLDARSITFMLGPSVILGRAQRLSVSTGVMGGRTSRLSAPYQPGQSTTFQTENLPKSQKYEYGWYLGLNINL
jgi:hypothetical protein